MITTVNSEQRVFQIVKADFAPRHWFCNLADIPTVIKSELQPHDQYKVYEFWNNKPKAVTRKRLNEMFEANQIPFKVK